MNYWPTGMTVDPIGAWPGTLTARRQPSPFKANLTSTMDTLRRELHQLGAKNVRLQIAVPAHLFRLDGYPRATAKPEHPGIILTLDSKHGPLSYPCDTYSTWQDNLRAIALALEALRKVDRYGVTKRGEQYRGFLELEARAAAPFHNHETAIAWLTKIAGADNIPAGASTALIIRRAMRTAHPDHGGDPATFQLVTEAAALAEGSPG